MSSWSRWVGAAVVTFTVTCLPSYCSVLELFLAMLRCEVLGRVSPTGAGRAEAPGGPSC